MTATVSVQEYIAQAFDKFYQEAKFRNIIINDGIIVLLQDLEEEVVELATQEHTTEAEMLFEEGYNEGFEQGEISGYERGFEEGYAQAIEDYEVEV